MSSPGRPSSCLVSKLDGEWNNLPIVKGLALNPFHAMDVVRLDEDSCCTVASRAVVLSTAVHRDKPGVVALRLEDDFQEWQKSCKASQVSLQLSN